MSEWPPFDPTASQSKEKERKEEKEDELSEEALTEGEDLEAFLGTTSSKRLEAEEELQAIEAARQRAIEAAESRSTPSADQVVRAPQNVSPVRGSSSEPTSVKRKKESRPKSGKEIRAEQKDKMKKAAEIF